MINFYKTCQSYEFDVKKDGSDGTKANTVAKSSVVNLQ